MNNNDGVYDYGDAGFDGFLSRSIDNTQRVNLDGGGGPMTRSVDFDRGAIAGAFPDSVRIGRILLDGISGSIQVYDEDGNTVAFYMGPRT